MFAVQPSFRKVIPMMMQRLAANASVSATRTTKTCRIIQCRTFSSQPPLDPILDMESFQSSLAQHAQTITQSLVEDGYYCTPNPYSILPKSTIRAMRQQSINLRLEGRFEQSWSEKIDASTGKATRFDKEGVFACEPDGRDYDTAPDLITYMSVLLQALPDLLNNVSSKYEKEQSLSFGLSATSFNAKLAVTSPGGSVYPLHIDNPQGLSVGDTRKLTCILYLNPEYQKGDGGELRIYHQLSETKDGANDTAAAAAARHEFVDLTPEGGRMVLFWSDEIPHEVLPTAPDADSSDETLDRYALTLWIPTENLHALHNPQSKFATLGDRTFP